MSEEAEAAKIEFIQPPDTLKTKVKVTGASGGIDRLAIQRAENALNELSGQFEDWLDTELARLQAARKRAHDEGLSEPVNEELFRAAHDLKGQGDTLGYPLVTTVCTSLCKLLDAAPDKSRIPLTLVDQHVFAAMAVKREQMKTADHALGAAVAERLLDVVMVFVDREQQRAAAQTLGGAGEDAPC